MQSHGTYIPYSATTTAPQHSSVHQPQNLNTMIPLRTQDQFESEIWTTDPSKVDKTFIIYFTADWCGACKRLDIPSIRSMLATAAATWYNIPNYSFILSKYIDENDYTSSFCDIRQIPTFVCIKNKKVISRITSSVNATVYEWLMQNI